MQSGCGEREYGNTERDDGGAWERARRSCKRDHPDGDECAHGKLRQNSHRDKRQMRMLGTNAIVVGFLQLKWKIFRNRDSGGGYGTVGSGHPRCVSVKSDFVAPRFNVDDLD